MFPAFVLYTALPIFSILAASLYRLAARLYISARSPDRPAAGMKYAQRIKQKHTSGKPQKGSTGGVLHILYASRNREHTMHHLWVSL